VRGPQKVETHLTLARFCFVLFYGRAQKDAGCRSIFDNVVKLAWDEIPADLKPKADRENVNEFNFGMIRWKYIISALKSEPVDILHVSEAPYFPDEGKITEAKQMLRRNGIEVMVSTAFGVGNLFEKRFMTAWKAQLEGKAHHWGALFFPWYTDPMNVVDVPPGIAPGNNSVGSVVCQETGREVPAGHGDTMRRTPAVSAKAARGEFRSARQQKQTGKHRITPTRPGSGRPPTADSRRIATAADSVTTAAWQIRRPSPRRPSLRRRVAPPPRRSAAASLRRRVSPPPRPSAAASHRRRVSPPPRLTADTSLA
jgi:hypothetical protein